MTAVWVVTRHEPDNGPSSVIAVTASLPGAQKSCTDDARPDWPQLELEWVQQSWGSWTTYVTDGAPYYTVDPWDVTA